MDLSFLKWPIIIGVIALVVWLASGSGVNFMVGKFTDDPVGQDAQVDAANEAGLSRIGGYCFRLWQYNKAMVIFEQAVSRYPNGKNVYFNIYRMARCAEKLEQYSRAVELLRQLMAANAHDVDNRVANNDVLTYRTEKLIELHGLEQR